MCWNTGFLIKKQFNQLIVLVLYRSYLGLVHYVKLSHHWLIRLGDILLVFWGDDLSQTPFSKMLIKSTRRRGIKKKSSPHLCYFWLEKFTWYFCHHILLPMIQTLSPKICWVAILLYKARVKLESADRLYWGTWW